jgi:hypothetical protein
LMKGSHMNRGRSGRGEGETFGNLGIAAAPIVHHLAALAESLFGHCGLRIYPIYPIAPAVVGFLNRRFFLVVKRPCDPMHQGAIVRAAIQKRSPVVVTSSHLSGMQTFWSGVFIKSHLSVK